MLTAPNEQISQRLYKRPEEETQRPWIKIIAWQDIVIVQYLHWTNQWIWHSYVEKGTVRELSWGIRRRVRKLVELGLGRWLTEWWLEKIGSPDKTKWSQK